MTRNSICCEPLIFIELLKTTYNSEEYFRNIHNHTHLVSSWPSWSWAPVPCQRGWWVTSSCWPPCTAFLLALSGKSEEAPPPEYSSPTAQGRSSRHAPQLCPLKGRGDEWDWEGLLNDSGNNLWPLTPRPSCLCSGGCGDDEHHGNCSVPASHLFTHTITHMHQKRTLSTAHTV